MGGIVVINTDECIGCETCVELCPDIFHFDSEAEKAVVAKEDDEDEECVEEAIESCPVECIFREDN